MPHPRPSATPEPTRRSLRVPTAPTPAQSEPASHQSPVASRREARQPAAAQTPPTASTTPRGSVRPADAGSLPTGAEAAAPAANRSAASAADATATASVEAPARRVRSRPRPIVATETPTRPTLSWVMDAVRDPDPAPVASVELRVEPVVVAEPLIAAESAAEPVEVAPAAIDTDDTPDLVEALVEDAPAHTILDDVPVAEPRSGDAFERAARAFSFTGEVPVVPPVIVSSSLAHVAPRRRRGIAKRIAAASVSLGALAMAGLLTVGMTTPAQAVATVAAPGSQNALAGDVSAASAGDVQAYVVPSTVTDAQLDRTESYSTGTMVDLAGTEGIIHYSSQYFTNDVNCPVQWPFATGTTISYGFGQREGEFHEGVDFTPGEGAHIQAVADGVVSTSTDSGGGYGVTIVIDIVVDGQPWSIRYGHMLYGSRQVQVGDHVSVGEFIGETGDTGYSFGAHTHVEVLQNRTTPIDPMPWFQKYNVC